MLEAMRLSELQLPLSGRLVGADASFSVVSTDSRAIQPGQLFIALTGPRFDGHAYLAEVAGEPRPLAEIEELLWIAPTAPPAEAPLAPLLERQVLPRLA